MSAGVEDGRNQAWAAGHPAVTDPDTGLANGLHFHLVYSYLFAAGPRGVAFAVIHITQDGATAGAPLREVGTAIRDTTRGSDLVAHLGDGLFVVLLLGSNLPGARVAADRMEFTLTEAVDGALSMGIAAYSSQMQDESELLDAARQALARAEADGGGLHFG